MSGTTTLHRALGTFPAPWFAVSPSGDLHILRSINEVDALIKRVGLNVSDFKQVLGVVNYTNSEKIVMAGWRSLDKLQFFQRHDDTNRYEPVVGDLNTFYGISTVASRAVSQLRSGTSSTAC